MYPSLAELLDNLTTYIDKAKNFHDQILCQTETEDIANEITQASTFYDTFYDMSYELKFRLPLMENLKVILVYQHNQITKLLLLWHNLKVSYQDLLETAYNGRRFGTNFNQPYIWNRGYDTLKNWILNYLIGHLLGQTKNTVARLELTDAN